MDSRGLSLLRVQSWTKPSWQVVQTGVLPFWKQEKKSREKEKGADRTAVWRIGAQSEGVEKSLHLNAPLHPNNSSASEKRPPPPKKKKPYALFFPSFLCFSLYLSSCEGHTPGCRPSGCVSVCVQETVLMWVYLKRSCGRFLGVDCSQCQYCSRRFGCHGNNYTRYSTVQSGQSQYYSATP